MQDLFILHNQIILSKNGYKILKAESTVKAHQKYLTKIGFVENATQPGIFEKMI